MEEGVKAYSSSSERKVPLQKAVTHPSLVRARHHKYADVQEDHLPFIGRLGGNQRYVLDPTDPDNAQLLRNVPDAAPFMTLKQQLDLRSFRSPGLWKRAVTEGMGERRSSRSRLYDASFRHRLVAPT